MVRELLVILCGLCVLGGLILINRRGRRERKGVGDVVRYSSVLLGALCKLSGFFYLTAEIAEGAKGLGTSFGIPR